VEESNGSRDPPSRQLLQESRKGPIVPDDEFVSEAARPSQLSSSPKSVHFSEDVVDTAQESANLLQKARSPRNTSLQPSHSTRRPPGRLKKPSVIVSSRYNGKIDSSIQSSGKLEPDRSRTSESSTYNMGNSSREPLERGDNRKRSTLGNSNQTVQSQQSQVGPVREKLKMGHSIKTSKSSSGDKWSKEDSLVVAVLRDEKLSFEEIRKVCVRTD